MGIIFPIKNIDEKLWQEFKRILFDELDPDTMKSISANKKIKQLIEEYVKKKSQK